MADYPSLFKISDIKSFLSGNDSVDLNLKFLRFQLNTYNEIYSHNSDADIVAYINKHNIKSLVYKGTIFGPKIDSIVDLIDFNFSDFHHLSIRYKNFQYQILLLIQYVEKEISDLAFLKTVFDDGFKICFDKDELYKIMVSFGDDDCAALDWIQDEYEKILSVIKHYSVPLFEKIHSKYCVACNGHSLYDKIPIYRSAAHQSFLEKLQNVLLPAIEHFINELDYKVTLEMALFNYDLLKEDDSEKFPDFDFRYDSIQSFSSSVFSKTEDKIEYCLFLLQKYNEVKNLDIYDYRYLDECASRIEDDLKSLKEIYAFKKNKDNIQDSGKQIIKTEDLINGFMSVIEPFTKTENPMPAKNKIPKRNQFSELINHYFEVALAVCGVPKLEELADRKYSAPSWSKKFDDPVFLVDLLRRIEKKLDSKRIKPVTKEVYIKLKLDVETKMKSVIIREESKTGQTSKHNKNFNDGRTMSKEDVDIFDGDEDYSRVKGEYKDNYNDLYNY